MDINNYKRLKDAGYEEKWLSDIVSNFNPKPHGQFFMEIKDTSELDDAPYNGFLIDQVYFDNPEDLYDIHRFFEGFAYVMKEASNGNAIGMGIIDYSPFAEMETYTGQSWKIPDNAFKYSYKELSEERKTELADSLIGHIYHICDSRDIADVLEGIGFDKQEIASDCEKISEERKCELLPELINHISEICIDEKDFVDVLKNLGFSKEEIEHERLMNYDSGPLATDIDSLIRAAGKIRGNKEYSGISREENEIFRD